jgi:hypothetical protein
LLIFNLLKKMRLEPNYHSERMIPASDK